MSNLDYQFWNLILNAFTAIGTVGAVIISLYVTLWPKRKFKIHDVGVRLEMKVRKDNRPELMKSVITFDIENKCDVQMQVFDLHTHYVLGEKEERENCASSGHIISFTKCFIPAKSRYNAATMIPHHTLPNGAMNGVKDIKLCLGTSFGEKTIDLPKKWISNYVRAIEKNKDETLPDQEAS